MTQGDSAITILTFIWLFGSSIAAVVFAAVILFSYLRKTPEVDERTKIANGMKLGTFSPSVLRVASTGINAEPQMSLGTVIMRPALGLRIVSIVPGAMILYILWGPSQHILEFGLLMGGSITAAMLYFATYIATYEVRYDREGVIAPDYFFRKQHYLWSNLMSVKVDESLFLHLRFKEHGNLEMQKYLVGIPSFLTFLSEIETLNRKP